MTTDWSDDDLAFMAQSYRNCEDVLDLIAGARAVLRATADPDATFTGAQVRDLLNTTRPVWSPTP